MKQNLILPKYLNIFWRLLLTISLPIVSRSYANDSIMYYTGQDLHRHHHRLFHQVQAHPPLLVSMVLVNLLPLYRRVKEKEYLKIKCRPVYREW